MEKCKLKDDKCNFFYLDELRADIYVDIFSRSSILFASQESYLRAYARTFLQ